MCENKKPLAGAGHSGQGAEIKGDENLSAQENLSGRPGQGDTAPGNSSATQRAVILNYLKTGRSLTTLYARNETGIMHPSQRCREFRELGHNIETLRVNEVDAAGKVHRVARYLLSRGGIGAGK